MGTVEIVFFGKGIGEAILFNCGDGNWVAVDCCYNLAGIPAAQEFLQNRGLDHTQVIKKIIISHFHNDHIKGMSKLISDCVNAEVFISDALTHSETVSFFAFHDVHRHTLQNESGVSEFLKVLDVLNGREQGFENIAADTLLHESDTNNVQVFSLSPSKSDCQKRKAQFITLLKDTDKGKLPSLSKDISNHNCITLLISTKHTTNSGNDILLGADLEITTDIASGWDAAISSRAAPKNSAKIFKIPHHGSITGYHPDTWNNCMINDPIGVLTTFNGGKKKLPEIDYVKQYSSLTEQLYCTTTPACFSSPKKTRDQKKIDEIINKKSPTLNVVSKPASTFGFVVMTKRVTDSAYQISLEGDAQCLKELLAAS